MGDVAGEFRRGEGAGEGDQELWGGGHRQLQRGLLNEPLSVPLMLGRLALLAIEEEEVDTALEEENKFPTKFLTHFSK